MMMQAEAAEGRWDQQIVRCASDLEPLIPPQETQNTNLKRTTRKKRPRSTVIPRIGLEEDMNLFSGFGPYTPREGRKERIPKRKRDELCDRWGLGEQKKPTPPPSPARERYSIGQQLGEGGAGKVFLGVDKYERKEVAIKVASPRRLGRDGAALCQEAEIVNKLRHKNIITCHEVFDLADGGIALTMPLASKGDMVSHIRTGKYQRYPEEEARRIFKRLLSAVSYMHSKGICHRDIKPENILFDDQDQPLLCDFSLAATWSPGRKRDSMCGTLHFSSPEMLEGEYTGPEVDIWSLGVVLYFMVSGRRPFDDVSDYVVLQKIKRGKMRKLSNVSRSCADLIKCLLETAPLKRPSISEISKHPWCTRDQQEEKIEEQVEEKEKRKETRSPKGGKRRSKTNKYRGSHLAPVIEE